MNKYCIIFTTTDDQAIANKLSYMLIENKLAACAQIDDVMSYYNFEGKIEYSKEYRIMIKTTLDKYSEVENIIKLHHNYTLPQIIQVDISRGLEQYLEWITNALSC